MSGVSPALMDTGMRLAGAAVGAIGEVFLNQAVKTSFTTMPTYTGGAVGVIAGIGGFVFGGKSPFIQGTAFGLASVGLVFVVNETFLSLPGISGTPMGVPNARPNAGFLSNPVAGYRGIPRSAVGSLSGGVAQNSIGALYRN
jgi:hypothetical protein